MSARVYFKKRVKDWKRWVYIASARWTVKTDKFSLFVYCNFLVLLSITVRSQNINKQNVNRADETLTDYSFLTIGITILNQRIIWKDDIEFVTEFPCLLGHPVYEVRSREDQVSREIWENRAALSYNLQTLVYTCTFTLGNGHPCKDSNSNFSTQYRGNLGLISQQENGLFGVPSRLSSFNLYAQGYSWNQFSLGGLCKQEQCYSSIRGG